MSEYSGKTGGFTSSSHHFAVEIAEGAHEILDGSAHVFKQITNSAAVRAFRQTAKSDFGHILIPKMNNHGNLRGIVVSKNSHIIYKFSSNVVQKFAKYDAFLATAGIMIDIAKQHDHIQAIRNGKLPYWEKCRMGALIVFTSVLRSVTSVVPTVASIAAKSLEGYCDLAELSGLQAAGSWKANLASADVEIKTAHAKIFSPEFMDGLGDKVFDLIEVYVDFKK